MGAGGRAVHACWALVEGWVVPTCRSPEGMEIQAKTLQFYSRKCRVGMWSCLPRPMLKLVRARPPLATAAPAANRAKFTHPARRRSRDSCAVPSTSPSARAACWAPAPGGRRENNSLVRNVRGAPTN